ncbi:hypothetical protein D3C87_1733850 [compost metagenome]
MTTLKLTVSELEDLTIEGVITTEAGVKLNVVKEGRWVSEGKLESKTVIFTDGERHYRGSVMREGSPFTDYTWGSEWDGGNADIEEVTQVERTILVWETVKEAA